MPRHPEGKKFNKLVVFDEAVVSRNLNAFAERFVRTIKSKCLERRVLIVGRSLRRSVRRFCEHYHGERSRQGLENSIIDPEFTSTSEGSIECRDQLGGMNAERFEFSDTTPSRLLQNLESACIATIIQLGIASGLLAEKLFLGL